MSTNYNMLTFFFAGMEDNLSLANQLTGRVMERCVSLAAVEKTLAEERGFEVLNNKINGKTWTQWKAELRDAVTRHELAGKKSESETNKFF